MLLNLGLNTHCNMKVTHDSNRKKSFECTSYIYLKKIKGDVRHYTFVVGINLFEQFVSSY